ncbi:hypothetical protein MAR_022759 [Mya arenaria]|uniref:Uncharacterized protein n=1 Tax=Mya arenaria TaxID=6604 RepID=A0ABY7DKZ7_MYAAR|nr:hypothetical protein MAR_022759 [Mya arenaria]
MFSCPRSSCHESGLYVQCTIHGLDKYTTLVLLKPMTIKHVFYLWDENRLTLKNDYDQLYPCHAYELTTPIGWYGDDVTRLSWSGIFSFFTVVKR